MPNKKGWLTKNEMMDTGQPCFIPDAAGALTGRWFGTPPLGGILLTATRCKQLGCPVKTNEYAVAYFYSAAAPDHFRYVPFFHRQAEELNSKKITALEERVLQREFYLIKADNNEIQT
ncbi:hypothetical protein [Paenibacillus rhizophilus]|uniref:Uncharacterized protein n=1 Tax=Paenibacillus rhizophilus TaxID=1850366 RepID=A0A3N9P184_9BACL|nr:hypothetical protein [Paenibacillus rhizophilus]RQW09943.1 hypothetical protein EH198_17845 [Paenibacillus rhizophilus]